MNDPEDNNKIIYNITTCSCPMVENNKINNR